MSITNNSLSSPSLSNIIPVNNAVLVTDGAGIGSLSTTLPSAVQANITALQTVTILQVTNPFVSNATPTNITATTATINAGQLCGGVITLNPTLAQTLTLPNAVDIDAVLGSITNNRGFWVMFVNQSAVATTLSPGTGTNLNGSFLTTGSVIIPSLSQRIFRIIRIDNTPTYSSFG